jgi:hypothetical protein
MVASVSLLFYIAVGEFHAHRSWTTFALELLRSRPQWTTRRKGKLENGDRDATSNIHPLVAGTTQLPIYTNINEIYE